MDKDLNKNLKQAYNSGRPFVLLNSSKNVSYSANKSFLLSQPRDVFLPDNFDDLRKALEKEELFGYISYEVKDIIEDLPKTSKKFLDVPLMKFLTFKNKNEQLGEVDLRDFFSREIPKVISLKSNMSMSEYLEKVDKCRQYILDGDISQVNLTRKFFGEFASVPDAFDLYCKLNSISPAPYSAYMDFGDFQVISSSPELFLRLEGKNALTCPIKGSGGNKSGDDFKLSQSKKDQAENLMITDLMRNDFSKVCIPGSVKVENLFKTISYSTISHMHSEIKGVLEQGKTSIDLIKSCFPPGSMTGTPKIRAMEIISELEDGYNRGIYSGALGYINQDFAEFSVVIRTLILSGKKFEFQVGGAIVYDSNPHEELQETMNKAKGIAKTLNIEEEIAEI